MYKRLKDIKKGLAVQTEMCVARPESEKLLGAKSV
jgi:hypothetical protein